LSTASWALYHRSGLKELIENITSLIDNIEDLFPAPQSQLALVKQETAEIQDNHALGLVESAAQDVNSLLQAAAKEALTGHQYLNVVIKGKAQTGDVFSSDRKGRLEGHLTSTTVWRLTGTERRSLETNMAGRVFGMIRRSFGLNYLALTGSGLLRALHFGSRELFGTENTAESSVLWASGDT
jgi:hypothetical protein